MASAGSKFNCAVDLSPTLVFFSCFSLVCVYPFFSFYVKGFPLADRFSLPFFSPSCRIGGARGFSRFMDCVICRADRFELPFGWFFFFFFLGCVMRGIDPDLIP